MKKEILTNSSLPPKNIHERGVTVMKENRKLLKEVLKDIRHDMTDEEVLNLLADSFIFKKEGKI